MKIAIATDAWFPQVNGVVRTLAATVAELDRRGHEVELITPQRFRTVPLPGYGSIEVALAPRFTARKLLHTFAPDIVTSRPKARSAGRRGPGASSTASRSRPRSIPAFRNMLRCGPGFRPSGSGR